MDEQALIRDAQSGDLDAFNALVLRYQDMAYNLAYRLMGDRESAEDATQEAFISAYRNIRRFRGSHFKAWLLRIVTNACYDELRRRKRRPTASLDALPSDVLPSDHAPSPENHAQRTELRDAIQDCIGSLPPRQRMVVVLIDVEGLDYREAAEVLGVPSGTVKSRLSRARAKLRDCLRKTGELLPSRYRLDDEDSD